MKTKKSPRAKKVVSIWSYPTWDQGLVLVGYPQDTKKEALSYLGAEEDGSKLKATVDSMTQAQIDHLEEFSG
jgi:hypothetical protein